MGGPASIPISEIAAYFDIYQIDDITERDDYIHVIQALDGEYLDYMASQRPKVA